MTFGCFIVLFRPDFNKSEVYSCALVTLLKSGNYRIYISNGQSVVIELSEISKDVEPTTLVDFKSNFCVMKKL